MIFHSPDHLISPFTYLQAVTPPQIVPYDAYENFSENFDLSILTSDNPYSATSFGSVSAPIPLPLITTTPPTDSFDDPAKLVPSIKMEQQWDSYGMMTNNSFANQLHVNVPQYGSSSSIFNSYPSPQSSNSSMSYENQFSVFPPSPTPSINDFNQATVATSSSTGGHMQLKQEFSCNLLLPPSPPDSNGAPSPSSQLMYMEPIKMEPLDYQPQQQIAENAVPLEDCVDIEEYFRGIRPDSMFRPIESATTGVEATTPGDAKDHQLLREYLQDTSFQRRLNLKPVPLESLFGGWDSRGDIEPVISLAMEQARRDVEDTSAALNISPGKRSFGLYL